MTRGVTIASSFFCLIFEKLEKKGKIRLLLFQDICIFFNLQIDQIYDGIGKLLGRTYQDVVSMTTRG